MLDKMTYTNHLNEKIVLGEAPYFANYNDLRDYSWNYTEANNRILAFNRKIRKCKLPVVIMCETEEEGFQKRNALFEIMEKDVLAGQYGTLQIGDYKLQCYINQSAKGEYLNSKKHMRVDLSIVTDRPYWTKEKTYVFNTAGLVGDETSNEGFLDFSYDFPYDFTDSFSTMGFSNGNFVQTSFKITIYGACTNPQVLINGHAYGVNTTVEAGQVLVIDSIEKTVQLITSKGEVVNKFSLRNKESYIFEKIPAGDCSIGRSENFRFDLTLIEERSDPKWT